MSALTIGELSHLLITYLEEYQVTWIDGDSYAPMTAQAYARARLMNDFDDALNIAVAYAETNGWL